MGKTSFWKTDWFLGFIVAIVLFLPAAAILSKA